MRHCSTWHAGFVFRQERSPRFQPASAPITSLTPIAMLFGQMQTATCLTRFFSRVPARSEGMTTCPLNAHGNALRETVLRTIAAKGYSELRTVEVLATNGRVVLRGTVASFYLKQVAQAAVCIIPCVMELCNEIEVMPASESLSSRPGGLDGRRE